MADSSPKEAAPNIVPDPATGDRPMSRPEWVHCVNHDHVEMKGTSWCGRDVRFEWAFVDPSHAAENGRQGGRLVACPECVAAIVVALSNGHGEIPETEKNG